MMQEQGVEVEAIAVKTPFCDFDCGKGCGHRVKEVAIELGINLKTVYFGDEYLKMIKDPKYGYGSGMNPCIDCRGMMYNAAKEHMEKIGADFIITGEVLGQRPMSQNGNALKIIESETQTSGKIVRPLSFKHLPLTEAESTGLVKREKLGDIKGRSRRVQLQLAKKYDIIDPPNAAGGCLLTDPAFSKRVRDLYDHSKDTPDINDVELLKIGRHFRLSDHPLSATVIYYGRLVTEPETLSKIKWPVLGIFGDKDESIPVATVEQFEDALTKNGITNEIYIFEGVGHAFANPSGDNYAPNETKNAWQKTLTFLNKYLK